MTETRIHLTTLLMAVIIATTSVITILPAAAQQSNIHIIKDGTNSYILSGSSSSVGSFDTTYRITG